MGPRGTEPCDTLAKQQLVSFNNSSSQTQVFVKSSKIVHFQTCASLNLLKLLKNLLWRSNPPATNPAIQGVKYSYF